MGNPCRLHAAFVALPQVLQIGEALQHGGGVHAEIELAGDLLDADVRRFSKKIETGGGRAEKRPRPKIPLVGELRHAVHLGLLRTLAHPVALHVERAADIGEERLAHLPFHVLHVPVNERVEHERHGALCVRLPGLDAGLAIEGQLLAQFLDRRRIQHRQEIAAEEARLAEGGRVAHRRPPHRQLRLDGARVDPRVDPLALAVRKAQGLAPPEPAHLVDALDENLLDARVGVR